jgi:hypothetical protein
MLGIVRIDTSEEVEIKGPSGAFRKGFGYK